MGQKGYLSETERDMVFYFYFTEIVDLFGFSNTAVSGV